jgi:hypothetical protein|nr:hypothetical protein [uncultured Psychroserpens sp.]
MKNNIIIFGTALIIVSLLLFGFTNRNSSNESTSSKSNDLAFVNSNLEPINNKTPDLYFGIDTQGAAINKTDIDKATTIYDFLNEGEKEQIAYLNSVEIIIIKDGRRTDIREFGESDQLTDAQIKLIRSAELFSQFSIRTDFKAKNSKTGRLEERFFNPHLTIVPEKQVTYTNGKEALINYFKDNSKDNMNAIKTNSFNAVMLYFTVTKQGDISNVYQRQMSTGYPSIDEKFIDLIKNIPGKWIPAENAKGEKIDQELVFTFGPRDGC